MAIKTVQSDVYTVETPVKNYNGFFAEVSTILYSGRIAHFY